VRVTVGGGPEPRADDTTVSAVGDNVAGLSGVTSVTAARARSPCTPIGDDTIDGASVGVAGCVLDVGRTLDTAVAHGLSDGAHAELGGAAADITA
jgi:hypothetical protein